MRQSPPPLQGYPYDVTKTSPSCCIHVDDHDDAVADGDGDAVADVDGDGEAVAVLRQ